MSSSPRSGGDPEKLMEPSHSPIGHHGHAGMAEESASELKLRRIGRGLSYTVGQHQPMAPVTYSSDPPPMSSSPRSGGDPGHPASSAGHPAPVSFPPTKAVAAGDPGTSDLTRLHDRVPEASSDEEQSHPRYAEEDIPPPVPTFGELSDSSYSGGEGLPSGETIQGSIEDIVSFMEDEILRQLGKVLDQKEKIYRIYKVPQITCRSNENAYAPQFVSFGPYHRDNEALRMGDQFKWFFLELIRNMNTSVPLRTYLEEMEGVKKQVEGCYEGGILKQTNYGYIMFLLDGCGILGFLGILPLPPQEVGAQTQKQDKVVAEASTVRKFISRVKKMLAPHPKQVALAVEAESKRTADSARIPSWPHDSVRQDLLLMENQLPFIVLQTIYGLATGTPDELKYKVDRTIQKLLASYPLKSITTDQSFHHLLQCCHLKFKPTKANSSSSNSKPTGELQQWRGATDLYKAGIKFKPKKCGPSESLLDVELVSGRTLMIPTLIIEDSTSSVFRNLIAFEQSCTDEKYFTAYAFFMGELMRTPGDVTLLVKKGVVENYLGADKEVSDFFNNLVKRVAFDVHREHFLSSTLEELKSSYNGVGKKHIAELMQNYFRSPWLVISVVAAAIVLVCTVVQTVFSVIK